MIAESVAVADTNDAIVNFSLCMVSGVLTDAACGVTAGVIESGMGDNEG